MNKPIKSIVEHDGKRWNRTELDSGAIIESEIVEPKPHTETIPENIKLLRAIAEKLGVELD